MGKSAQNRTIAAIGAVLFTLLIAAMFLIAWGDWEWGHSFFAPMCHQKSERCLVIGGTAMAVCGRCLGIYAGLALGCAGFWARSFRVGRGWLILTVAAWLNILDIGLELGGIYENAIAMRLVAGFLLGAAIPVFVFSRMGSEKQYFPHFSG